jgi:arginase family enzyme
MDIVEIAPSIDREGVTSIMGVAMIMHYLAATKVR